MLYLLAQTLAAHVDAFVRGQEAVVGLGDQLCSSVKRVSTQS